MTGFLIDFRADAPTLSYDSGDPSVIALASGPNRVWCYGELLSYDGSDGSTAGCLRRVVADWESDRLKPSSLNGRFVLVLWHDQREWHVITDRISAMHAYGVITAGGMAAVGSDLGVVKRCGSGVLDWEGITSLFAFGFFLDDRTHFSDVKILQPHTWYRLGQHGDVLDQREYWQWRHEVDAGRSYDDTVEQYDSLLLVPSTLLTIVNTPDLGDARELISFNLSGPFALAVSAWFFSHVHITREQFQRLAIAVLAPITGIAAIVVLNVTTNHINWTNDSNFEVVNGFGPNQISGILGLGILIVWFCLLYGKFPVFTRVGLAVLGFTCIITAMLTFSRGGLYTSLIVIAVTGLQAVLKRGQQKSVILYMLVGCVLLAYIVVPRLDDLTNGTLNTRLSNTDLTNRDILIYADLQIFLANPLTGVGPGMATGYRDDLYNIGAVAAHTEYTRMLAEHGILGALAVVLIVIMVLNGYQQNWALPIARNMVLGCALWATVMMTHSAMRIAAVSFMFGLLFAHFDFDDPPPTPVYQNRFFSGFYNPRLPPGVSREIGCRAIF